MQQTVHRMRSRKIVVDFCDDFLLRARQFERKRLQKSVQQYAGPAVRLASANRRIGASGCNQHLHCEEFGEDQMLARGIPLLPIFREMNGANRRRPRHVAIHECTRQ